MMFATAVLNPVPAREPMTVVDFPDQLRNDIFYCQRALKEHIKIHQFCAVQMAIKPSKRYALIIKCIEDEIQGIADDQQKVIATMKKHLHGIHQKMMMSVDHNGPGSIPHNNTEEFDSKIIRSYLDMHRPSMGGLALQASGFVQSRASEKDLIRNFDLLSDLQLFMRPTTVIERLPLSPMKPGGRPSNQSSQSLVKESRRNFMATLKAVKPQQMRAESESDDEDCVRFLSEGPMSYDPTDCGLEGAEVKTEHLEKKHRGRPRKPKRGLLSNGSAPSTRANSPVTMPWVELPAEPEETNNYDQTGFMQRLGLYTQEMATYLKNKRPERRKRTVQSTEKTDFHYGQLDMNKDRVSVLSKSKKPAQQYLSPRTFKKRRTFDRSASSSPPNDGCTCSSNRNGGGRSPCPKCTRKST